MGSEAFKPLLRCADADATDLLPACAFTGNLPLLLSAGIICLEFDRYRGNTENNPQHDWRSCPSQSSSGSVQWTSTWAAAIRCIAGTIARASCERSPAAP